MNYTNQLAAISAEMKNILINLVIASDKKTMVWRGQGGEKYVNLSFEIKQDNHYCVTDYKALQLDRHNNLSLHTDVRCDKGTYLPIERLTLEQLALLTDLLSV